MSRHGRFVGALLVSFTLLLVACGGDDTEETDGALAADDTSSDDTDTGDEAGADDGSGAEADDAVAAADGEPIAIGYINQEDGAGSTFPDLRAGTEAAVAYVNANGGVNGRPVELVDCSTDGSPEASQACANEMVEAGVPVVNGGIDFGSPASIPVFGSANVPYVPTLPTINEEYVSPNVYTFFGGSAGQFAGQVGYILSEYQPTRVGVLVIDVPQGVSAAELLVQGPLEGQGVEVDVVAADPTTADFTPSLTALMRSEPDLLSVLFTGPPCGAIMQSVAGLGIDVPVLYPSGCIDQEYLDAGGDGANGAIFSVESEPISVHADDPDVELFVSAMSEYAGIEAADLTTYNQVSFAGTFNLLEALKRIDGDITSDAVVEALTTGGPHESLMAPDYTCDGTVLPGFTTLCNVGVKFVQYDGGSFTELTAEWS